jgi:hypothetical protein
VHGAQAQPMMVVIGALCERVHVFEHGFGFTLRMTHKRSSNALSNSEVTMSLLKNVMLQHRARKAAMHAFRFAERLRKRDSEFAPSYRDTIENIGDELAVMARDLCVDEAQRRALLSGLMSALKRMYRADPALAQRVTRRLAPRVLAAQPEQCTRGNSLRAAV